MAPFGRQLEGEGELLPHRGPRQQVGLLRHAEVDRRAAAPAASHACSCARRRSEKGVRLALETQVGPHIPVGIPL